ncbi:uncharacterized protein LOC106520513 [Austrofundulus limnaeus]|uniref:Uncharacterized protein LOC106520513 n=1 Tax=Austrofundulus limnaeus TaxID=52670 RepID=A0A2I4BK75_AUSLI|nr:PREDICTED: uncharacterized protein LOC106520513 [Austrofundulus limnaeus]
MNIDTDIDPDNNFLDYLNDNCHYYTDDNYSQCVKSDKEMSIIHFNSRSLYANYEKIKEYLYQLKKSFSVIAITETWLTSEKGVDFILEGYEFNYINRKNKKGGGVALYINNDLKYKVVEKMSVSVDEVMECITIEIQFEKQKNIMVSCVYRAPASDTEVFTNYMETLFAKMHQKVIFICGDFNIDMLNPNMVKSTSNFIDTMHSLGLYPLITKPSRITTHSSTLIDNIFTNYMESKLRSGLLINDISDHLPVFVILEDVCRKINKVTNITYKRIISEDSIRALRNDLQSQNWEVLYEERNIDKAFEIFIKTFKAFYD